MFNAKRFVALLTALTFLISNAHAATNSATPSSNAAKPKAKTSAATKVVKKKPVYKPKPRKKVHLKPRQEVNWPPAGFESKRDVYAKIPNARQVLDSASTDAKLRNRLNSKICDKFTCGAVIVAAETGCVWWEITGDVVGPKSATDRSIMKFGSVKSYYGVTIGKEIRTILIVSGEPRKSQNQVVNIDAICHTDNPTVKLPSETYEAVKS